MPRKTGLILMFALFLSVINGRDRQGLLSAKTRIDLLVESARQRQPFTHFISIPVNSEPIQDRFGEFKDDIVRFCGEVSGIVFLFPPSTLYIYIYIYILVYFKFYLHALLCKLNIRR